MGFGCQLFRRAGEKSEKSVLGGAGKGQWLDTAVGCHHRAGCDQSTFRAALQHGDPSLALRGRGWAELGVPGGESLLR